MSPNNDKVLVKLNNRGAIQVWYVIHIDNPYVVYGNLHAVRTLDFVGKVEKTAYKKQLNKGYVRLSAITTDFNINDGEVEILIREYFKRHPVLRSASNSKLPMLAKKLFPESSKLIFPYFGQRKYNGLRCKVSYNKDKVLGMFDQPFERVVFNTKSGNEYYYPSLAEEFYNEYYCKTAFQDYEFDGEFYIHGKPLNYIKSCISLIVNGKPSKTRHPSSETTLMIYDMITHIEDEQSVRIDALNELKPSSYWLPVETVIVNNLAQATMLRDQYLDEGYEGIILRKPDATYGYGKRGVSMWKFKLAIMNEFKIIDVIDKGFKAGRVNVTVLMANDENSHTFEATPGDLNASWNNQSKQELLDNKANYIGKLGTVSYYERSGVKKVPAQANFVTVRNYE